MQSWFNFLQQHLRTPSSLFGHPSLEEKKKKKKGRTTEIFTPHGIQRKWEIPTFEDNLNTYPRYLLPYPDATLQLTDIHNGIYLHNMVCHIFVTICSHKYITSSKFKLSQVTTIKSQHKQNIRFNDTFFISLTEPNKILWLQQSTLHQFHR